MSENDEASPRIARYKPYYFKPVPGKSYLWCSCGRSANQPFCDGSHKGSGFEPVKYVAGEDDGEVLLCGCKHTRARPFCDGSHNNLITTYESDDPQSESNKNKIYVAHHRNGRFELNGNCYVGRIGSYPRALSVISSGAQWLPAQPARSFRPCSISKSNPGSRQSISFGTSEVILFVTRAVEKSRYPAGLLRCNRTSASTFARARGFAYTMPPSRRSRSTSRHARW